MLYKKYHRNFVKQFKIGAKFIWWMSDLQVNSNPIPIIEDGTWWIKISVIITRSRIFPETLELSLVIIKYNGELNKEVDNVIQEIS